MINYCFNWKKYHSSKKRLCKCCFESASSRHMEEKRFADFKRGEHKNSEQNCLRTPKSEAAWDNRVLSILHEQLFMTRLAVHENQQSAYRVWPLLTRNNNVFITQAALWSCVDEMETICSCAMWRWAYLYPSPKSADNKVDKNWRKSSKVTKNGNVRIIFIDYLSKS